MEQRVTITVELDINWDDGKPEDPHDRIQLIQTITDVLEVGIVVHRMSRNNPNIYGVHTLILEDG